MDLSLCLVNLTQRRQGAKSKEAKKQSCFKPTKARGYRAIIISQEKQYLIGFAFDRNVSQEGYFTAPYNCSNTTARDAATFTIPAFNPANLVNAPAGATHFRLINALDCVSDFAYNEQTGTYEPIDTANNFLMWLIQVICH